MSFLEIKNCKYITSIGMMMSLDDNGIITYDKNNATYNFEKIISGKEGRSSYYLA